MNFMHTLCIGKYVSYLVKYYTNSFFVIENSNSLRKSIGMIINGILYQTVVKAERIFPLSFKNSETKKYYQGRK